MTDPTSANPVEQGMTGKDVHINLPRVSQWNDRLQQARSHANAYQLTQRERMKMDSGRQ